MPLPQPISNIFVGFADLINSFSFELTPQAFNPIILEIGWFNDHWSYSFWSFKQFLSSIFYLCFNLLAHNGFGLRAGGHFEAQNFQFTIKFISCKKLQITTIRPLAFSPCYQLGVLVCQWFEIVFQFSHSVSSVLKRFCFFSVGKVSVGRQTSSMAGFGLALACATWHCAWLCGLIFIDTKFQFHQCSNYSMLIHEWN